MAQITEIEQCIRYQELLYGIAKTQDKQEQLKEISSNIIFLKQHLKLVKKQKIFVEDVVLEDIEQCIPFTQYNSHDLKYLNMKINPKTLQLYIGNEQLQIKTAGRYKSQYYSFNRDGTKYTISLNKLKKGLYNQNAYIKPEEESIDY